MAWTPVSGLPVQYQKADGDLASGYYLKFYADGTTTPINMAIDDTGVTQLDKCQINASGYPINGSNAEFIPHINQEYKVALYTNATDADNNTIANVDWVIDDISTLVTNTSGANLVADVDNLTALKALTATGGLARTKGYSTAGLGSGLYYHDTASTVTANDFNVVSHASGTGRWILIPEGGVYSCNQAGAERNTDSTTAVQKVIDEVGAIYGISISGQNGPYLITSTLTVQTLNGFNFFGTSSNDKCVLQWAGTGAGNVIMRVRDSRQVTISNIKFEGHATRFSANEAATGLIFESTGVAPATQNRVDNCLFSRFQSFATEMNVAAANQQNDIITFYNCFWSDNQIHMRVEGAATFFFNVIGGNMSEWRSGGTGVDLFSGFGMSFSHMMFTVGGTVGGPSIGFCVTRRLVFGEVKFENVHLEGNCEFWFSEDDTATPNEASVMFLHCTVGTTAGGTNKIIDHRQRGPVLILGGSIGGAFGTHTIDIQPPSSAFGGLCFNLATKLENTTFNVNSNGALCGWDPTGEFYSGNTTGNVIGGSPSDALSATALTLVGPTANATLHRVLGVKAGGGSANMLYTVETTDAVSTTATRIVQFISASALVLVTGGDGVNEFFDLLSGGGSTVAPVVIQSHNTANSPAARTYTNNAGICELAMGSGTYDIHVQAFQLSRVTL